MVVASFSIAISGSFRLKFLLGKMDGQRFGIDGHLPVRYPCWCLTCPLEHVKPQIDEFVKPQIATAGKKHPPVPGLMRMNSQPWDGRIFLPSTLARQLGSTTMDEPMSRWIDDSTSRVSLSCPKKLTGTRQNPSQSGLTYIFSSVNKMEQQNTTDNHFQSLKANSNSRNHISVFVTYHFSKEMPIIDRLHIDLFDLFSSVFSIYTLINSMSLAFLSCCGPIPEMAPGNISFSGVFRFHHFSTFLCVLIFL